MPSTEEVELYLQAKRDVIQCADYPATGSLERARKFTTALRRLIMILPRRGQLGGSGGEGLEFDLATLSKQLEEATAWISRYNQAQRGGTHYLGFDSYRD